MFKKILFQWRGIRPVIMAVLFICGTADAGAQFCNTCFNPAFSFPNGGNLSTSGMPLTMNNVCVAIGGTFIIDASWTLNNVCFRMDDGSRLEVANGGSLFMEGGTVANYSAVPWDGIVVRTGSVATLNNVGISFATIAMTGEAGSAVVFTGSPNGQSSAIIENGGMGFACTGCALNVDWINMVGVVDGFSCTNATSVNIQNSSIQTALTGALINGGGPVNISNNPLFRVAGGSGTRGIYVSENTSGSVNISNNTNIVCNQVRDCISLVDVSQPVVTWNVLTYTRPLTATPTVFTRGIYVNACSNINVSSNTLNTTFSGPGEGVANVFTYGIDMGFVSGRVANNILNSMDIGVIARGSNSMANKFSGNRFNGQMRVGLWLNGSTAVIGQQDCQANLWNGTFSSNGARNDGLPGSSIFTVGGGAQMPPNVLPVIGWFVGGGCLKGGGGVESRSAGTPGDGTEPAVGTLSLSPNPVASRLRVGLPGLGGSSVEVRDLAGKLVVSGNTAEGTGEAYFDLSGTAPGLYLVTVRSEGQTLTEKVVVAGQ